MIYQGLPTSSGFTKRAISPKFAGKMTDEEADAYALQSIQQATAKQNGESLINMLFRRMGSPLFEDRKLGSVSRLGYKPRIKVYQEAKTALTQLIFDKNTKSNQLKTWQWEFERANSLIHQEPYPEVKQAYITIKRQFESRLQALELEQRKAHLNSLIGRIEQLERGPVKESYLKSDDSYSSWVEERTRPQGDHKYEQIHLAELLYEEPKLHHRVIEAARKKVEKILNGKLHILLQEAFDAVLKPNR